MVNLYQNNDLFQTPIHNRIPVKSFTEEEKRYPAKRDYSQMTLREELEARFDDMERQQKNAEQNQTSIYESFHPNHNYLTPRQRINALRNGIPIRLEIEDNPDEDPRWPRQHSHTLGSFYINRYNNMIDKYANKYRINPSIPKAVMYTEAATGHYFGFNMLADMLRLSGSQMPMNIQGKTWGNMDGRNYDTHDSEQNVELGVKLLRRLYDAVPDHDLAKIGTLWNETGAQKVNHIGAHIKYNYDNKSWDSDSFHPQLIERK